MTAHAGTRGPTLGRAIAAEWRKFVSLPAYPITALVSFGLIAGMPVLLLVTRGSFGASTDATELLTGVSSAQIPLGMLAAVLVCVEWSSGTRTTTFLAFPARLPVLAAKAILVAAGSFAIGAVGAALAMLAGAIAGVDVGADPEYLWRSIAGAGLYLAALSALALAIGAIVRGMVGGVLAVVVALWVAPFLVAMIPVPWVQSLTRFLPTYAGGHLIAGTDPTATLTPWAGFAVLVAWTVAALAVAALALRARDV